jgi:hypothetical protein
VISSNSKGLTGVAARVAGASTRPALSAGYNAALPLVVKAACRNLRREAAGRGSAEFEERLDSQDSIGLELQADYLNTNGNTNSRLLSTVVSL